LPRLHEQIQAVREMHDGGNIHLEDYHVFTSLLLALIGGVEDV
jgi:hypothetical protein